MNPPHYQMRRATIEDLVRLRSLWAQAALPVEILDKHLTEFQVAEAADGVLLACVALQLDGQQGKIHSPAYRSPEARRALEQPLWERVQSVAKNHGLWRLWTQDPNPFWRAHGFEDADANAREKLPPRFGPPDNAWLVVKLRDEVAPAISFEHEFELFKQSQQDWTNRALRQARVLRILAILLGALLFAVAGWMLLHLMQALPTVTKP